MLDTIRDVATPELVELEIHCAGPVPRVLAYLLDLMVRGLLYVGVSIPLGAAGQAGLGVFLVIAFAIEWLYPVLFEVLGRGATPGKRAVGLAVVTAEGSPVGWGPSLTRNLLRTVDFLPFGYCLGLLAMLLDRDFRRLGDIVAGTVVAYREPAGAVTALPAAPPWAPGTPVSREGQQAVLAFAQRAANLSPDRQAELAALVPGITGPVGGELAARRLIGYARRLTGLDG